MEEARCLDRGPDLSLRINTLRNRVRRTFTVEAKSSGTARYVSIPSKPPREPRKRAGQPEAEILWPSLDGAAPAFQALAEAAPEHRRILPSLLIAEVHEPEPEAATEPEELPRVRRASPPTAPAKGAPRRRGRPRRVLAQEAVEVVEQAAPEPTQPVVETAPFILSRRRPDRAGSEKLRLGERWKRRLPKACW